MNIISKLVAVSMVASGALGAGGAQARSDVQWSVQIGGPIGVAIGSQPYVTYARPVAVPVYVQPGYAQPGYFQPGYVQPGYVQPGYLQPEYAQPVYGWRSRYDHIHYSPRWDRDGDGTPKRYDRYDNRRYDRHDDWRDGGRDGSRDGGRDGGRDDRRGDHGDRGDHSHHGWH